MHAALSEVPQGLHALSESLLGWRTTALFTNHHIVLLDKASFLDLLPILTADSRFLLQITTRSFVHCLPLPLRLLLIPVVPVLNCLYCGHFVALLKFFPMLPHLFNHLLHRMVDLPDTHLPTALV